MDWHRLERIAFGIKKSRHRGRGSRDPVGVGEVGPGCRGPGFLPSPPPPYIRSPMHVHTQTETHRLVCGPISAFIYECLSICLSICVWSGDEWSTAVISVRCHRLGPPISVHNPNSQEQVQDKMTGTGGREQWVREMSQMGLAAGWYLASVSLAAHLVQELQEVGGGEGLIPTGPL